MKFNERLKKLRLESGQTLKFIAKELNLSISAYSNYEQGIREPSLETLAKICKVFDVSADYLL
ncbi:MAG: helix-turn-helix transcriptional regulator, partial [Clostridia bacterium]|nr:helix-turn-helix transcriptional regulator [Clostridia bacterium]